MLIHDTFETELTLYNGNPELQHYNWDASMTGGDCGYCHAAPSLFLPAGYMGGPGFCFTCHNPGGRGHEKGLCGGNGHSLFINATSAGRKKPTYGNITTGEYNNQPFSRLQGGHLVVCVTCHNAMQKSEDPGRTWEYTTTTDQVIYTLQNGGWSEYGYMVPKVYRDTSLWPGPTYSKDKKAYLVSASEYAYDEYAGTVTFHAAQPATDYIYVSLDYPYLRASSEDNRLCSDCHAEGAHQGANCLVCHQAHNTGNVAGLGDNVRMANLSTVEVKFLRYTGLNSFADGDTDYDGICEACHTSTKYYKRDGTGFANHSGGFDYDGSDCSSCHSHAVGFTKAGFAVRIDSPFDNATSHEYGVMVKGCVIGRDGVEVGVTVNGYLAEVSSGVFAIADLPLTEGVNTITAFATDANGMTATDTITVSVVDPAVSPVSISATPSSGPAPLEVVFTIESNVPDAALFELDYEGDGTPDASSATFDGMTSFLTHTYTSNGLYYPAFKVTDNVDEVFEKSTVVNAHDAPDLIEIWNAMRAALSAGDVNKAVMYFSPTTRESYRYNLTTLAQNVPQALAEDATEMANIQIYEVGDDYALGDLSIFSNGVEISFGVHFIKDKDGIWRIEAF